MRKSCSLLKHVYHFWEQVLEEIQSRYFNSRFLCSKLKQTFFFPPSVGLASDFFTREFLPNFDLKSMISIYLKDFS